MRDITVGGRKRLDAMIAQTDDAIFRLFYEGWLRHALSDIFSVRPDGWDENKYDTWFGSLKNMPYRKVYEKIRTPLFENTTWSNDEFEVSTAKGENFTKLKDEILPYVPSDELIIEILRTAGSDAHFWLVTSKLGLNHAFFDEDEKQTLVSMFHAQDLLACWLLIKMFYSSEDYYTYFDYKYTNFSDNCSYLFMHCFDKMLIPSKPFPKLRKKVGDSFWLAVSEAYPYLPNLFGTQFVRERTYAFYEDAKSSKYDCYLFNAKCGVDEVLAALDDPDSKYKKPDKELLNLLEDSRGKSVYEVITEAYGKDTLLFEVRYQDKKWNIFTGHIGDDVQLFLDQDRKEAFPIKERYIHPFVSDEAIEEAQKSGDKKAYDALVTELAIFLDSNMTKDDEALELLYQRMMRVNISRS